MIENILPFIKARGINITNYNRVYGGDINETWRLDAQEVVYFLKINDAASYPQMFEKEADGLHALQKFSSLLVPRVIQRGAEGLHQWLLLEWMEQGKPLIKSMQNFGRALAAMHRHEQPSFGWHIDNFIGSIAQVNRQCSSWEEFYGENRIMALVKKLFDAGLFSASIVTRAVNACKNAANIFPVESPALLHGDLWNGNFMITPAGEAAIFDPAVYCGHREMDLGLSKLFGGFDQSFYDAYNELYPLENNWQQRLPLTQLYPLLVHAVLFGGQYTGRAAEIINRYGK